MPPTLDNSKESTNTHCRLLPRPAQRRKVYIVLCSSCLCPTRNWLLVSCCWLLLLLLLLLLVLLLLAAGCHLCLASLGFIFFVNIPIFFMSLWWALWWLVSGCCWQNIRSGLCFCFDSFSLCSFFFVSPLLLFYLCVGKF